MKKIMVILLAFSFVLTGCIPNNSKGCVGSATQVSELNNGDSTPEAEFYFEPTPEPIFAGLDDPALLDYVEDRIYVELSEELGDSYFVNGVSAAFVSKEYIEELTYNSKENLFFGYSLSELDAEFQGTRYVFTLGDNGETEVVTFEEYDDTYEKVIKNVAIGVGVIAICVVVSVATYGAGAPAVSAVFLASAKTGAIFAASSGAISAVVSGTVTGLQTEDFDEALKAGALAGSESFKWAAVSGAVIGGASELVTLNTAAKGGLTLNEAASLMKEHNVSANILSKIKSADEAKLYFDSNLYQGVVDGKLALIRKLDLDFTSELNGSTVTNLQRMLMGRAPIDPATGAAYELHHIGQSVDSPLSVLTMFEHRQGGHYALLHDTSIANGEGVHSLLSDVEWNAQCARFWRALAETFAG